MNNAKIYKLSFRFLYPDIKEKNLQTLYKYMGEDETGGVIPHEFSKTDSMKNNTNTHTFFYENICIILKKYEKFYKFN